MISMTWTLIQNPETRTPITGKGPLKITLRHASRSLGRDHRYPLPPVIAAQKIRFYSSRGCVEKRQFWRRTRHFSLHEIEEPRQLQEVPNRYGQMKKYNIAPHLVEICVFRTLPLDQKLLLIIYFLQFLNVIFRQANIIHHGLCLNPLTPSGPKGMMRDKK